MKNIILLLLSITVFKASAQTDTTLLYFDKKWQPSSPDTAFYNSKVYKQADVWERKDFWVKTNNQQMQGTYMDKELKKKHGSFTWFKEDGTKDYTTLYKNDEWIEKTFFYEDGARKSYISSDKQMGWDKEGKLIPGYVVEKEAKFTGDWKGYLQESLNANVAADAGAPEGIYTVKVQFLVDKEGNITNVNPIDVPSNCLPCGKEAVRVISKGPKWIPAVQNGRPVIYQAIQSISFQVEEVKMTRRRG